MRLDKDRLIQLHTTSVDEMYATMERRLIETGERHLQGVHLRFGILGASIELARFYHLMEEELDDIGYHKQAQTSNRKGVGLIDPRHLTIGDENAAFRAADKLAQKRYIQNQDYARRQRRAERDDRAQSHDDSGYHQAGRSRRQRLASVQRACLACRRPSALGCEPYSEYPTCKQT